MLRKTSLILLLLSFFLFQDACFSQVSQEQAYIPGQVLVKFNEGVSEEQAQALHDRLGSTILKRFEKLHIDLVRIKSGLTVEEATELYQENPQVAYAEPNYLRRMQPKKVGDTP